MKWARRAITIPGLVALFLLDLAALPILVAGALVVDLVERRPLSATRFHVAVAFALGIHVVGLGLMLRAWFAGLFAGRAREAELELASEVWWATETWRAAVRLYGMTVDVEGEDAIDGGPIIVMSRHASLLDVLLPVVFVSGRHDLALRYVVKRELVWDPCIDLLGSRVAMAFVRRDSPRHEAEIALVETLANGLGPGDGVVIYPEGTRFSEEKRAHALARLAEHDPDAFAYATRLTNVLPPHPGGPLGLLERAPDADVVFCAHTGLEGASHLRDLLAGSLVGARVAVRFWRVPAAEIPQGHDARLAWLRGWWERIDQWIGARRAHAQTNRGAATSETVPSSFTRT